MTTIDPHRFTEPAKAKQFILAGNATLTIVSLKTGTRFTFRVRKGKKRETDPHFVSVLDGGEYNYLGCIFPDGTFKVTRKSIYNSGQPCARAFIFLMEALAKGEFHPQLEVWHEGKCGKCGRQLTVPESIATGLGPECSAVAGVARVKLPRPPRGGKRKLLNTTLTEAEINAQEDERERRKGAMDDALASGEAEDIEREMQRMEARGDDIQTYRENLNKMLARSAMEGC
jgi:hypothetical protein